MIYKEVTYIEGVPEEWKHTNDWDSHRELLWLCVDRMDKTTVVYEFGMGAGSTPLLIKYCSGRLVSLENNIEWSRLFSEGYEELYTQFRKGREVRSFFKHGIHVIYGDNDDIISSLRSPNILHSEPTLVLVDSAPGDNRKDIISSLKNVTRVIIAHDTEESAEYVYGMKEILSTFKYRLDYKPENLPHTTAVSNFINVTEWV